MTGPHPIDPIVRFQKYVVFGKPDECWIWNGQVTHDGYGRFLLRCKRNGGMLKTGAHRAAYELMVGPIPPGKLICHHCDVKRCVNPRHLYAGTYQSNVEDMDRRGRRVVGAAKGETNHFAKLKSSDVEKIRKLYKNGAYSQEELAYIFDMGQSQISRIIRMESWGHVPGGG